MAETVVEVSVPMPLSLAMWLSEICAEHGGKVPRLVVSMLREIKDDTERSEAA